MQITLNILCPSLIQRPYNTRNQVKSPVRMANATLECNQFTHCPYLDKLRNSILYSAYYVRISVNGVNILNSNSHIWAALSSWKWDKTGHRSDVHFISHLNFNSSYTPISNGNELHHSTYRPMGSWCRFGSIITTTVHKAKESLGCCQL